MDFGRKKEKEILGELEWELEQSDDEGSDDDGDDYYPEFIHECPIPELRKKAVEAFRRANDSDVDSDEDEEREKVFEECIEKKEEADNARNLTTRGKEFVRLKEFLEHKFFLSKATE